MNLLISCESGGEEIPSGLIVDRGARKPDTTAAYVAAEIAARLRAPYLTNRYAPDLIDVGCSLHNRRLFPAAMLKQPAAERQRMIDIIYHPYRALVRTRVARMLSRGGSLVHLSFQSFPPVGGGERRRTDMGLLYDPAIAGEVDFCLDWIDEMYDRLPMLRVRRNYPQRGTRDGLTRALRSEFSAAGYLGVEVVINRAWAGRPIAIRDKVIGEISQTLRITLDLPHTQAA